MSSPLLLDTAPSGINSAKAKSSLISRDTTRRGLAGVKFADQLKDLKKKHEARPESQSDSSKDGESKPSVTKSDDADAAFKSNKSDKATKAKNPKKRDDEEEDLATLNEQPTTDETAAVKQPADASTDGAPTDDDDNPSGDATSDIEKPEVKDADQTADESASAASLIAPAANQPAPPKQNVTTKNTDDAGSTKKPADTIAKVTATTAANLEKATSTESKPTDDAAAKAIDAQTTPVDIKDASDDVNATVDADDSTNKTVDSTSSIELNETKHVAAAGFLDSGPALKAPSNAANSSSNIVGPNQSQSQQSAATVTAANDALASLSADEEKADGTAPVSAKRATADIASDLISAAAAADGSVPQNVKSSNVSTTAATTATQTAPSPERQFAADNHSKIITSMQSTALANGGTMNIRLDPPELGDLQISVSMRNGVMNASFETTTEKATRALSHSLGDLKSALETSGVAVDKLHVQQASKNEQPSDKRDGQPRQNQSQDTPGRRDQERREMLQRMWRKLANGSDPLDTLA